MKPWGVSTIVTEGNNTFGKITGKQKMNIFCRKYQQHQGKNI